MEYIKIRKFEKYNHYKERHISSWIKLYYNMLDDYKISQLNNEERWIWCGLLLLAGKSNNNIPNDLEYIFSKICHYNNENRVKIKETLYNVQGRAHAAKRSQSLLAPKSGFMKSI